MIPDWALVTGGVILGVGTGLGLGYLLVWYSGKGRP
jgi:hypothetical protein